ncbi:MAG: hypothetical protein Phyf2KO_01230 [Phycisphaerales bacterium]
MSTMSETRAMHQIDEIMEKASGLLAAMRPLESEQLSLRALDIALKQKDWDRLARIVMPLQEARRLRRQEAADSGKVRLIDTQTQLRAKPEPGCYLFQPPLIAAEARAFRESALRRGVCVFVMTREPMTRDGKWPIAAVGALSVRTKVNPPDGVEQRDSGITRDEVTKPISVTWFESAAEALGDAAIASVDPNEPAAHRVEDLIERLDAFPEHEKLHQALERAAEEALTEPAPTHERRRGLDDTTTF